MIFDSVSNNITVFEAEEALMVSSIEKFQEESAPPLEELKDKPISGWVSPRFTMDIDISQETMIYDKFFCGSLMKAEKKIPPKLLKAYCQKLEFEYMAENNVPSVNRKIKSEIKKAVKEQLLPQMPPALSQIDFAMDTSKRRIFTNATNDNNRVAFATKYTHTVQSQIFDCSPESLAERLFGFEYEDYDPIVFCNIAENAGNEPQKDPLGYNFLTWLLFYSETQTNSPVTHSYLGRELQIYPEFANPIVFYKDCTGAQEVSLRAGEYSLRSLETKTCLQNGKKLKSANLSFVFGGEPNSRWSTNLDAGTFTIKALKCPKAETSSAEIDIFKDKLEGFNFFWEVLIKYFSIFINTLMDNEKWNKTLEEMKEWINNRDII